MNCITIDDEQNALDVINSYINKVPFLNLSGSFVSSLKALEFIQNNKIDLILIDIEMPDLTGIQFLKSLEIQPLVIFTTAYSEYAVDSFEFNVIDYLMKPIEFTRFLKAVNKANSQHNLRNQANNTQNAESEKSDKQEVKQILVKSGSKIHKLIIDEILYVESYGNYVNFYTKTEKIISIFNMKQVLELLPKEQFARVHKSYIVALNKIDLIERHQVTIEDNKIPIGKIYREGFLEKL